MHKQLFIPGPTEVSHDVLMAMTKPLIGHRTKECSELQKSISQKVQKLFYTDNVVVLSTSSGSGLMEAAIRSCTAKKALCTAIGSFGKRWYKMAEANNVPATLIEAEAGEPISLEAIEKELNTGEYDLLTITHSETSTGVGNDLEAISRLMKNYPNVVWCVDAVSSAGGMKIEMDKLGIDILLTSSHKALALPPGMALCAVSQKAYERTFEVKHRGLYFDLQDLYKRVVEKNFQYPSTPNVTMMYGLDYQLDRILEEGLEARFARHKAMAERVRAWAKKYFDLFPNENYMVDTQTVIKNTRGISVADLNEALAERGKTLSNGYGDLKEKTFRIAHMGELTMADVDALLKDIEEILGLE